MNKTLGGQMSLRNLRYLINNKWKDLPDDTPVSIYNRNPILIPLDSCPHLVDTRFENNVHVTSHSKVHSDTFKSIVLTQF